VIRLPDVTGEVSFVGVEDALLTTTGLSSLTMLGVVVMDVEDALLNTNRLS
jgi:hypothetical protein